jgi:hypothetical protein
MKLINKTELDPNYVRKVVGWVRDQVGLRADWITEVRIRPSRSRTWSFRWDHGSHRVNVFIKRNSESGLAWALAYVLGYMAQAQDRVPYARGPVKTKAAQIAAEFEATMNNKLAAAALSQDDVDMLCAKAGVEGFDEAVIQPATKAKLSPVQQRAKKAAQDLVRWERKLKLAKGKVAKLQKRVAYYAKSSAQ